MNRLESNRTRILLFVALLLLSCLGLTLPSVVGQVPLNLSWTFNYSPLLSGATNSLQIEIVNTASAPVRVLSLNVRFAWMEIGVYLSSGIPEKGIDIAPGGEVQYMIPLQVPVDTLMGRYDMLTVLQYETFQTSQYSGPEGITYVQDVLVVGPTSSYSFSFDPSDGRIYSAGAIIILLGWYLPKKLPRKARG